MKNKFSRRTFFARSAAIAGAMLLNACGQKETQKTTARAISEGMASQTTPLNAPYYPPAWTGLRGDHAGSDTAIHSIAREGRHYTLPQNNDEEVDLVVIGAGISGLTAAYQYHKQRPDARILILDNHDDFGGHAKRHEFTVNGKTIITYGGSESFDAPESSFSDEVKQYLLDLGIDYHKFKQYFDQDIYSERWGLKKGIFFNQKAFGKDMVVQGLPENDDEEAAAIIRQFPLSEVAQQELIALYAAPKDYLAGMNKKQRLAYAEKTSYYDFLKDKTKIGEEALRFLFDICTEYWGQPINGISLATAAEDGYPGVQKLGLPESEDEEEPYIYHFPDGNASVARILVRQLIPAVAAGKTMEDVVTADFDYSKLDVAQNPVRIRLNSTALHAENTEQGVAVVYMNHQDQKLYRIGAAQCIFAGHAAATPSMMPQMPAAQQEAMRSNVHVPMVYGKVLLKNAQAFVNMGVYSFYMPNAPYCLGQLDDSVNMGDYTSFQSPDEPIVLHMVRMASDISGEDSRTIYRNGRAHLFSQTEQQLRQELLDQVRSLLAVGEVNLDDVLLDVTIDRWAHGYSYEYIGLWDDEDEAEATYKLMQQPIGNIFMAGCDVAWAPYMHDAIEQGMRAANEAVKKI